MFKQGSNKLLDNFWNVLTDLEDKIKYGHRIPERVAYVPVTDEADTDISPQKNDNSFTENMDKDVGVATSSNSIEKIIADANQCRKCVLGTGRKNCVPGEGVLNPIVMVIGEGPGAEEDAKGRPFVGAAGQYLDKWLNAIYLDRNVNCFIGNIVKCRPPGNRDPLPEESDACRELLERQIELLKPKAILTVGRISSRIITGKNVGIGRIRGTVYNYNFSSSSSFGIPVVATYHPSAVLRDRTYRKSVWDDLNLLKKVLEEVGVVLSPL